MVQNARKTLKFGLKAKHQKLKTAAKSMLKALCFR